MDVALIFLIPPQISVTTIFFFLPLFRQCIAIIATKKKISSLFRQWYCHNWFFFFSISHFKHTAHLLKQTDRATGIWVITLPKFMHSLSPTFSLSLSLILLLNFGNGVAKIHSLSSFP